MKPLNRYIYLKLSALFTRKIDLAREVPVWPGNIRSIVVPKAAKTQNLQLTSQNNYVLLHAYNVWIVQMHLSNCRLKLNPYPANNEND